MSASEHELGVDEIDDLLRLLGERLQARGIRGSIYLVGGAAMAIGFNRRRVTKDVDGVFAPTGVIGEEARMIAEERHLPPHWLNDRVAAFLPDAADGSTQSRSLPGLDISIASPEHLLAMKLAAFRDAQDIEDLKLLFCLLEIDDAERAVEIAIRLYGEYSVVLGEPDDVRLRAEAVLEAMAADALRPPVAPPGSGAKPSGTSPPSSPPSSPPVSPPSRYGADPAIRRRPADQLRCAYRGRDGRRCVRIAGHRSKHLLDRR